ncbi:hypothetical protein L1887_23147 [Cichorium endivia]|nr:hypothetical protein L1887_23147 [Cichorium endivia]
MLVDVTSQVAANSRVKKGKVTHEKRVQCRERLLDHVKQNQKERNQWSKFKNHAHTFTIDLYGRDFESRKRKRRPGFRFRATLELQQQLSSTTTRDAKNGATSADSGGFSGGLGGRRLQGSTRKLPLFDFLLHTLAISDFCDPLGRN